MFDAIEEFCKNHEHTIAAIEAGCIFASVVASLWIALLSQKANRTALKAWASIGFIMHDTVSDKKNPPTYLTVSVTNTGLLPLMIPLSFFRWKLPFRGGWWWITPLDYSQSDAWIPQKKYPVEIKPKSSELFFLSDVDMLRKSMRDQILNRKKFWDKFRLPFLRPMVITDDGFIFKGKMDNNLRKEIRKLRGC